MKNYYFLGVFLLFLIGCDTDKKSTSNDPSTQQQKPLTAYVNPFVGTGGHGHTYPGATMPFGMMQLSPDTRLDGWDGCSGYHYSDDYIYGFSHTHLSGTGVSDYGDILIMPTDKINFNNGANGEAGYSSSFSHDNEKASPGFYQVYLDDTDIDVALTVTARAGMHRYEFPTAENQIAIIDLLHRDKTLDAAITVVSSTELEGYRFSEAWATDQRLFFSIKTSHPFEDMLQSPPVTGAKGAQKIALTFNNPNNEPVYISIGISAVDVAGAKKNRTSEIGSKNFLDLKKEAALQWEHQLSKIVVEDPSETNKHIFYSALYHTMLAPNLYQDVDGRYRGMDLKIHQTTDFDYYTVFSLWDTYRAAHPLYTIIEQDRTNDFVNTMLAKYQEGGTIPIWDLSANYTGCMIGYHGVPVIVDAYEKGIRDYDTALAFKAIKHSAMQDKLGLEAYKKMGFVPVEEESESVSKTLEYAYDDWTIAQMAKSLGKDDDYKLFMERGQNYKNVFNPATGFMQGRFNNTWFGPFDPYEVNFNYTEANAWQYSLYAPQDISGLIKMMGGAQKMEQHLDNLFTAKAETSGRDQADITGLIGQYAHGNEPSHHMAYLYNFVNKPAKTQAFVRQILTELYSNEPDGISGNEDCGQMSAWYIFSSLGFYPVTPGSNEYVIGAPLFENATIQLENGNKFKVNAANISEENKYIESVTLNGNALNKTFLSHSDIMDGGILQFTMTNKPSTWGTQTSDAPATSIDDHKILLTPFIAKGEVAFKNNTTIELAVAEPASEIFYTLDNGSFKKYTAPFKIEDATTIKTYAEKDGRKSKTLETKFYKIDPNLSLQLNTTYANEYSAGGNDALIDGIRGAKDFRTGAWQGYSDKNVDVVLDLGSVKDVNKISTQFLQDQRSWIFFPTKVTCWVSENGTDYTPLKTITFDTVEKEDDVTIRPVVFKQATRKVRYIKMVATNLGPVPEWHLGHPYDGKAWLFIDEISVK